MSALFGRAVSTFLRQHKRTTLAAILFAVCAPCLTATPASAAGVVSDCTIYGPGSGTLQAALQGGGLVTFACSGTVSVPNMIIDGTTVILDATGQRVTLSGSNSNRLFTVNLKAGLEIRQLTLANGNTANGGGAIRSGGNLTVTNSTLMNNRARYGGAIELFEGTMVMINSTVTGNQATGSDEDSGGGAIDMYYREGGVPVSFERPHVTIAQSTITANSAVSQSLRSGIWQESGRLILRNSIVAGNGTRNCQIGPYAWPADFNVEGANLADALPDAFASEDWCRASIVAAPLLGGLGDTGNATPIFPLQAGSPAIDAAPLGTCPGSTDQRRILRPRDGDGDAVFACDLGAFEYGHQYYADAAAGDGTAGHWRFDEGSGATASDASGNGLTGALQGGAGFTTAAAPVLFANASALSAGAGGSVQVANASVLNPVAYLTLSAWVRLNSTAGEQPIVAKVGGPGYRLGVRDGALFADIWDSTNTQHSVTGGSVIAGAWLHLAVTWRSGGEMVGYINGAPVATTAAAGQLGTSSGPLVITVNGAVDDVRVYDRTLSAGQVGVLAGGRSCITTATNWADAMVDLQCVLLDTVAGDSVWVAQGTYTPTRGQARAATFTVGDGVSVYGGFAGSETALSERAPAVNRTVLSGDIERNDQSDAAGVVTSPAGIVGNNAYHVVTISSSDIGETTTLDGFIVTAGQADGPATGECGPACGGGIVSMGGGPVLRNLSVVGNRSGRHGGGVAIEGGAPVVINSLVAGNLALLEGGGIYAANAAPRLVNVSVGGNTATTGGGLRLTGGEATILNSVVGSNTAPSQAQIGTNSATVEYSLVEEGCPENAACASVVAASPLFVDPLPSTDAVSGGGDYRLQPTSPAIDAGTNSASLGERVADGPTIAAIATDLGGGARVLAVRSLPAVIDAGAYEMPNSPPVFTSVPVTLGITALPYTYTATAFDPNDPSSTLLAVNVITRPSWLTFVAGPAGSVVGTGVPTLEDLGDAAVELWATDPVGAVAEQAFEVTVVERIYPLYLPTLRK